MTGWVRLCAADAVGRGAVVRADHGDTELVVWRSHDGVACVMAARCPHNWSHLAAEGVVDGDEVVCAAHLWRFGRDGTGSVRHRDGLREPTRPTTVHDCREEGGAIWALLG